MRYFPSHSDPLCKLTIQEFLKQVNKKSLYSMSAQLTVYACCISFNDALQIFGACKTYVYLNIDITLLRTYLKIDWFHATT